MTILDNSSLTTVLVRIGSSVSGKRKSAVKGESYGVSTLHRYLP